MFVQEFGTLDIQQQTTIHFSPQYLQQKTFVRNQLDSFLSDIFSNINEPDYICALETDHWYCTFLIFILLKICEI
jgi:hypothetical protein